MKLSLYTLYKLEIEYKTTLILDKSFTLCIKRVSSSGYVYIFIFNHAPCRYNTIFFFRKLASDYIEHAARVCRKLLSIELWRQARNVLQSTYLNDKL